MDLADEAVANVAGLAIKMPKITSVRDLYGLRSYNYTVIDGED